MFGLQVMPIRPEFRKFYGRSWRQVTRPRILERAGNKCENCGKPNHAAVDTATFQAWIAPDDVRPSMFWRLVTSDTRKEPWRDQLGRISGQAPSVYRRIEVVLTIAHLNHVAGDDRDENLRALCQWCHLNHDKMHHKETRCERKDAARPLLQEVMASI